MVDSGTFGGKGSVFRSMLILAGLVGASVVITAGVTVYLRSLDPVNQCIQDPDQQPYQITVPLIVIEDGFPAIARQVGIGANCIRPVHTLEDNVIRVAYERPYDFTLGHFFYYWLGDDILRYDVKVYVNDELQTEGDFRDIVLRQGDNIRIELVTKK